MKKLSLLKKETTDLICSHCDGDISEQVEELLIDGMELGIPMNKEAAIRILGEGMNCSILVSDLVERIIEESDFFEDPDAFYEQIAASLEANARRIRDWLNAKSPGSLHWGPGQVREETPVRASDGYRTILEMSYSRDIMAGCVSFMMPCRR